MEELNATQIGRAELNAWQQAIQQNNYRLDDDFKQSITFYLTHDHARLAQELASYAEKVITELDPLVIENNLSANLPRLEAYDGIGYRIDHIVHHPSYAQAGDIIYSAKMLERLLKPNGLVEASAFLFLSAQTGEAGHHCPLACSAGIVRVFKKVADFPNKDFYLEKLLRPSYHDNYTGAQFLTEVQGGSDVGNNATLAYQDNEKQWRIRGEKWFCSNADADLIFITARYNPAISGTRGLGLFLIPAKLPSGEKNNYTLRRLKDKLGTRSMASAEIDFHDTYAIPMGAIENSFPLVMENVLHISRLLNTVCMLGMARRAYYIAKCYTQHRIAFDHPLFHYPLIKENLARIKAENSALLASIFATLQLQDAFDHAKLGDEKTKLLLRLLANINKTTSAAWSVDHIHHALDMLAGNGAIETFSILPRLFRDSIVCENWEGTHNTLSMQVLRDIHKYNIDALYVNFMQGKLEKFKKADARTKIIAQSLEQLKNNLRLLKAQTPELQTLQIKPIVTQMTALFGALNLLQEALQQTATTKSNSKIACFDYFALLHLNNKAIDYDQKYLDLITTIVSE
jgi:acyl-CoA dehydrogenase